MVSDYERYNAYRERAEYIQKVCFIVGSIGGIIGTIVGSVFGALALIPAAPFEEPEVRLGIALILSSIIGGMFCLGAVAILFTLFFTILLFYPCYLGCAKVYKKFSQQNAETHGGEHAVI